MVVLRKKKKKKPLEGVQCPREPTSPKKLTVNKPRLLLLFFSPFFYTFYTVIEAEERGEKRWSVGEEGSKGVVRRGEEREV